MSVVESLMGTTLLSMATPSRMTEQQRRNQVAATEWSLVRWSSSIDSYIPEATLRSVK